jgi:predicted N-acetyltransferase YhbS
MVRYELHEAAQMDELLRAEVGQLIVSGFERAHQTFGDRLCEQWAQRAWRTVPSQFHYVAHDEAGLVVAQQSVARLSVPSDRVVLGLGDMVVAKGWRGRGLARDLIALAVEEAKARGAQVLCTRTTKLAGVFATLGFASDGEGLAFSDEGRQAIGDLWVWMAPGVAREREALHPSDF